MKTRFEFLCPGGRPSHEDHALFSKQWRSPFFAFLGFRPIAAQHTREEDDAIRQAARMRKSIVEIGVAEGASAAAIRQEMAPDGTLYLIDPFHLGRWKYLNGMKRAARSAVGTSRRGRVVWIEKFSQDAVSAWRTPIDFLFIDGDHREAAVHRDWDDWHSFVVPSGLVAFHDARVFAGGWLSSDAGPVKLVNHLFRHGGATDWRIIQEVHSLVIAQRKH